MTDFYINQVFTGTYPCDAASFCNENGLFIAEIDKEGDVRRFQIQKLPALTAEEKAAAVRAKRDRLLEETDKYVCVPDYPVSGEEKEKYLTYRQFLRDVPDQAGFPDNVVWPVFD